MNITLYHGSNVVIDRIDLSFSRKGKDFGKGFYLNPDYSQAEDMARRTHSLLNEGVPVVNCYEFDLDEALEKGLNIKAFDDYSQKWADFVVMNRKNKSDSPVHEFDVVIGPIADDSVGVQIRRYIMGFVSVQTLIDELRFHGDKAIQYFFGTERSLEFLKKI